MTKARLFPLLTAALLLAACAAPEPEPTPTAVPTFTVEPTATATQTPEPTPTPKPLVKPFMIVEGMVIHQLCEAIQVEYPQAGCPIVAHEDVPLDHKFMAFMDENGELTGYGLDFGRKPEWYPGPNGEPVGFIFDPEGEPGWCAGETDIKCDSWLYLSNYTGSTWTDIGNGFWINHINETSKDIALPPDGWVSWHEWAMFPATLQYQEILEGLGIRLVTYVVGGN